MCPPFRRLLSGEGRLFERWRLVCHCLLLETADGLALVDTGFGAADVSDPKGRLGVAVLSVTHPLLSPQETALAQIEAMGLSARDVRHVLPTHLDMDHVGGLSDFPDATVHVLDLEHAAATAEGATRARPGYRPIQWAHGPKWQIHSRGGERWLGFDSVRAVPGSDDDILLIPLLGHSPGHCGIAVRTETGWILHAGDAYFAHVEIHGRPPRCPRGLALYERLVQFEGHARVENQQRLRELVQSRGEEVTVICAHDCSELDAATRAPAPERIAGIAAGS